MDLGSGRDQTQHDPLRLLGAGGVEHAESVRLQGGSGPRHAGLVRHGRKSLAWYPIEVRLESAAHLVSFPTDIFALASRIA